jgi:hypothetical protein
MAQNADPFSGLISDRFMMPEHQSETMFKIENEIQKLID